MNKSNSIIYYCFICNFVEHKVYNCPHKDMVLAMFKEKATLAEVKKENVSVNMVLVITTHNQLPKNVIFKEREPHKNKSLA